MAVFLHETIDPVRVPGAHTRYLAELGRVVETEGNAKGSAGGWAIAAWVPIFLTGQWPQIITFWQMPGGWDGVGAHFDAHPELFHAPLERWFGERAGGFDRVLVGADYAPTVEDIARDGRRAPVVLHETVQLPPGAAPDYLAEIGNVRERLAAAGSDVNVFGGYEVALRNQGEVIVLWTYPDVRTFADTQVDVGDRTELQEWRKRSRALERSNVGVLLRPTDWSPLR